MGKILGTIIPVLFLTAGCGIFDPGIHQVRLKNNLEYHFDYVKIGSAYFNYIPSGTIKEYLPIEEGTHKVTGEYVGGSLEGSLTFDGFGKHYWTAIIAESGTITLIED